MALKLKPFAEVLDIFKASNSKKKPKSFDGIHYAALSAWSFGNLNAWPSNPPVPTLLQIADPKDHGPDVLKKASALLQYANFGNAIGTWNAGGEARFASGKDWILANVSLVQEQASDDDDDEGCPGDSVDMLLAVWRLSDGWAAAVLDSNAEDFLMRLMGLDAWPTKWKTERVWYGE